MGDESDGVSHGHVVPEYGKFSKEEIDLIKERTKDLRSAYRKFKTGLCNDAPNLEFSANQNLLILVAMLYVNDLKEYKLFHKARRGTDNLKRAAYISRWISNVRPIETDGCKGKIREEHAYLNEQFAIYVFFSYLHLKEHHIEHPAIALLTQDLKYIFRFRDPQRELLVAVARMTEAFSKGMATP